jgi:hypothetical protein
LVEHYGASHDRPGPATTPNFIHTYRNHKNIVAIKSSPSGAFGCAS